MNKKYRVESFGGIYHENNKTYFDNEHDALIFAGKEVARGKIVFLLKHIIGEKYDVVEEIK